MGTGVGVTDDLGVGLALAGAVDCVVDGDGAPAAGGTGLGGGRVPQETSTTQATADAATARVVRAARIWPHSVGFHGRDLLAASAV